MDSVKEGRKDVSYQKMKMLHQIKEKTLLNRQKNEDIHTELKVKCIIEKVKQAQFQWYGHLYGMKKRNQVQQIWEMEIKVKRPRKRPRRKKWRT